MIRSQIDEYLGGPAIRERLNEFERIYKIAVRLAGEAGWKTWSPHAEFGLEHARPEVFTKEIIRRIKDSNAVMIVVPPEDLSAPVEAAVAAMAHKPQLLVCATQPPRILKGLPGVVGVTDYRSSALSHWIHQLMRMPSL